MIYKFITKEEFINAFKQSFRFGAWTEEGLEALYDHIEEYEDDQELDVDEIDSCWCEYESITAAYHDQFPKDNPNISVEDAEDHYDRKGIGYIRVPHTDRVVVFTNW